MRTFNLLPYLLVVPEVPQFNAFVKFYLKLTLLLTALCTLELFFRHAAVLSFLSTQRA